MVLTLVTAGIVSAAALPKNFSPKPNAAPIPLCDPWASPDCH
jgi:hypothetical protein